MEYPIERIKKTDPSYPVILSHISDPPDVLYMRGSCEALNKPGFAVVGMRRLTEYGKEAVIAIVSGIAQAGFTIISGLATGIDTCAHEVALDVGGATIAVLGTGLDDSLISPADNRKLAKRILDSGGALISEYPSGTHGSKLTFPQRNRIISGLSKGVLVVEADSRSGALITAQCALDQNRDVFAVPGSIFSRGSRGTNWLLKEGARIARSSDDILACYQIDAPELFPVNAENECEAVILDALSRGRTTIDALVIETARPIEEISTALVVMEMSRKVRHLGNGAYVLYSKK